MKRPTDLLHHDDAEDSRASGGAPQRAASTLLSPYSVRKDEEDAGPACEKPAFGEFVQNLGRSIVERNAQARKGPRGHQSSKQRSRQALSRALSKLIQD